ncbi:MAG: M23 family metallopeptidase [Calditrichaeota bacterium]|nr:MAG: M23 family peptidase [Calditrichota bacterium]MBL1207845.1 M23 family metallopeptidase [Calditrichota bacterium]NOG47679.1 M23 family metallopeptidase [Calditrichota bacterium]
MKDESRLIFVRRNNSEIKEFKISRLKLFTYSLVVLFTFTFVGKISLDLLVDFSHNSKIKTLERTNTVLQNRLSDAKMQIDSINTQINLIVQKDDELRVVMGLPQIDSDVREVGIGGSEFAFNFEDEVSGFEDNIGLGEQLSELAKLERAIKLELSSYQELMATFHKKQDSIRYVPSLKPVLDGRISSSFGMRNHPRYKVRKHHEGLDLSAPRGTPIYASADGVVKKAGWGGGYGKMVVIDHKFGYETRFGHMSKYVVRAGQTIKRGQKIGEVGNTGVSTAPHLHYEVRYEGKALNPKTYYFEDKELNRMVVKK